jgi:glycosyltransferase involved in cell wall biosynthesis
LNFFFKYRFLQWRLGIKVLDEATKIVCLSPSYKEKLIEIYFRKNGKNKKFSEKIEIIPNGMDNFYLKNSYKDKKLLQNKIRILTVGDISKRKNQLTVCKALANSNLDIEYTIVGKVKDEKYFSEIKKFKFVNYIDFIEKNELIQLYRKNDVFVLPSLSETFGIVYAEAMSQNLPVIYSKGEGFDNQFDSGVVGYEVNAKSSNDVLLGIEKIIKHRDAFNKNYKYARKFSWEKIVKKQEKLYMEIIRG